MFNYFVVRFTNRQDGTAGKTVKEYEAETDALKEFFRQAGQAVDTTHLTDSVTLLTKEGFEVRHEVFLHDLIPEVEPEPEGEPTEEG